MKVRIFILYFFMLAGGLWNALGVLQDAMELLAAPLIISLGIWTFTEARMALRRPEGGNPGTFTVWTLAVMILSIAVEGLGVHTGLVFGVYTYGDTLQPQVFHVPIAIGFAWFTMMVSSWAVVQRVGHGTSNIPVMVLALATGLVMTGFDSLMEPAAMALGYWNWTSGFVPFQNYATWFALSFLFALAGLRMKALPRRQFRFGLHVFFAQAGYFVLTTVGPYLRSL